MRKTAFLLLAITAIIISTGNASAGSNGNAPQNGQDWIITQDTHVWDETVSVKDIVVNFGKTLKLENVSLSSKGFIEIRGETRWINSTIFHEQDSHGDNISLYSTLTIINSELTLDSIQKNSEITANCLDLNENSVLIVTDYDLNPATVNDRSIIKSNVIGKGNYTERLDYTVQVGRLVNNQPGSGIPNTKVIIENSDFEYVKALRFTGADSYINNSTFDMIGIISAYTDDFRFINNTILNSYIFYDLFVSGENALIQNNTFINGTLGVTISYGNYNLISGNIFRDYIYKDDGQGGRGTLTITQGSNHTIIDNQFLNNTIHDMSLQATDDNIISRNMFNVSGVYWHNLMDRAGNRNEYSNNTFINCGSKQPYWGHSCMIFWFWDFNTDEYYGGGHLIENNYFENYTIAIFINSFQNNNTIRNNIFDIGWQAIGLWGWPEGGISPSGNYIINNTINDNDFPIALDFENVYNDVGTDNHIISNYITNTSARAITVWNFYKNFTIVDNYIDNASIGIWIYDNGFGDISNGVVANNTLKNIKYNGISAYTQFGSAFTIDNIHVTNNFVHSIGGAGIMFRDVEEGYIANNTVQTNMSHESQLSGIYAYYIPKTIIKNNTLNSAVGIEVGGFEDSTSPIIIEDNILYVNDYGILSNRTYSKIVNNNVTGLCTHDRCDVLYLQKVAAVGIFSQEGEVEVSDNIIMNFRESITVVLADFDLEDNIINFSEIGITANNSEGRISNNILTNNTQSINSYRSDINILSNVFNDFEKAIYSFNSTISIDNNIFSEGDFCLDLIDSDSNLQNNDFECRETDYLIRYNLRINIADEQGAGSREHGFDIENSFGSKLIDSQTDNYGFSDYYMINVISKAADENEINYNPIRVIYYNNDIMVEIYKNLSYNHTLLALLDTTSPQSEIIPGTGLINSESIELQISLLKDDNDFKEYVIEYIVNDEFAQWEVYGTFTESVVLFTGEDGKEYRFRSLARDIYGNTEIKNNYEYQVKIDTSVPITELLNFVEDYYFIGNNQIEISWKNSANDIAYNKLEVSYSNFTNANLNPDSVTWIELDSINIYGETQYIYEFDEVGHYAFKIIASDYAGNIENKDEYDVIMNYASKVDTISFSNVPQKWGYDYLEIFIDTDNLNLDYKIYIAIQTIEKGNDLLTWYLLPHNISNEKIKLQDLQDNTRYFLYAESRDLAGNLENPLETTEYFSSNGQYDQSFNLKYIPAINDIHWFNVSVDNDLDGTYEKSLVRGMNKNKLLVDEYYLDISNKTIKFGGTSNGGFVPTEDINGDNNIKIEYSGVHLTFEVFTEDPLKATDITIKHTNSTELILGFVIPEDAAICKVQRADDELPDSDSDWFTQQIISSSTGTPCKQGYYEWIHKNPIPDRDYFYRITIEDEFGHISVSDNETVNMEEVVKLYSSTGTESNQFGMKEILPVTIGISLLFLMFGGVLLYRSRREELDENVSIIESKPIAKYKVEELYLIYKDGRLLRNVSAVEVKTDTDIMSGMLTAINDFVQDSFQTEGDLGSIDYGNNKIILQRGEHSYLAAVIYGEIDNMFKGKLINAVRTIEAINPNLANWDGDAESVKQVKIYLNPIIDETIASTREMVDNYFTEKEIVITSSYEKLGTNITLNVNLSNYSSETIIGCKISPEFNSSILGLAGIDPDVYYSFSDNSFIVGDISSYNEVQFKLKMQQKSNTATSVEIKMMYEQKGREGLTSSRIEIA